MNPLKPKSQFLQKLNLFIFLQDGNNILDKIFMEFLKIRRFQYVGR